jgi:ankyrin repeat protein
MKVKTILVCIILFAVSGCATSFKSPLINTASKGDIVTAQKLMIDGANINERNRSGLTPLMMSIEYGKPDAAKAFIQMGADFESKDK